MAGATTEHPSRVAADAEVEALRRRYLAGARALRVVRVYDPAGGVRLVDFGVEQQRAAGALGRARRAAAAWETAVGEADARLDQALRAALAAGHDVDELAAETGLPVTRVRRARGRQENPTVPHPFETAGRATP